MRISVSIESQSTSRVTNMDTGCPWAASRSQWMSASTSRFSPGGPAARGDIVAEQGVSCLVYLILALEPADKPLAAREPRLDGARGRSVKAGCLGALPPPRWADRHHRRVNHRRAYHRRAYRPGGHDLAAGTGERGPGVEGGRARPATHPRRSNAPRVGGGGRRHGARPGAPRPGGGRSDGSGRGAARGGGDGRGCTVSPAWCRPESKGTVAGGGGLAGCSQNEDGPASAGVTLASVAMDCAAVVAGADGSSLPRPRLPGCTVSPAWCRPESTGPVPGVGHGSAGCSQNEDGPTSAGVTLAAVVVGCPAAVAGGSSLARPRSPASARGRPGETGRRGRTGDIGRMDEPAGRLWRRESDLRDDAVRRGRGYPIGRRAPLTSTRRSPAIHLSPAVAAPAVAAPAAVDAPAVAASAVAASPGCAGIRRGCIP